MPTQQEQVEAALKATRAARNAAHDAAEDVTFPYSTVVSEAKDLILKAEGLLAQARYFISEESDT